MAACVPRHILIAVLRAVLLVTVLADPLFSLHEYDYAQCDPSLVPHAVSVVPPTVHAPLLVFTSSFALISLPRGSTEHPPLLLLDARTYQREEHFTGLVTLLRSSLVPALLATNSDATELWNSLAVFETDTGFILPFYSGAASEEHVPLFHIDLGEAGVNSTRNVLYDKAALDYVGNQSSVLEFMQTPQLSCLHARLHCRAKAPTDQLASLCRAIALRLPTPPATSLNWNETEYENASLTSSFDAMRHVVAAAVNLTRNGEPEQRVRDLLFLPPRARARRFVPDLRAWLPLSLRMVALSLLALAGVDAARSRTTRRYVWGMAVRVGERALALAAYTSAGLADRAKLI